MSFEVSGKGRAVFARKRIAFFSSETIISPWGCIGFLAAVWGAGGGACYGDNTANRLSAGAGGGYAQGAFFFPPKTPLTLTVGSGGITGGAPNSGGNAGGATSISGDAGTGIISLISATGGDGGQASGAATGGVGVGGSINFNGGNGSRHLSVCGTKGGPAGAAPAGPWGGVSSTTAPLFGGGSGASGTSNPGNVSGGLDGGGGGGCKYVKGASQSIQRKGGDGYKQAGLLDVDGSGYVNFADIYDMLDPMLLGGSGGSGGLSTLAPYNGFNGGPGGGGGGGATTTNGATAGNGGDGGIFGGGGGAGGLAANSTAIAYGGNGGIGGGAGCSRTGTGGNNLNRLPKGGDGLILLILLIGE